MNPWASFSLSHLLVWNFPTLPPLSQFFRVFCAVVMQLWKGILAWTRYFVLSPSGWIGKFESLEERQKPARQNRNQELDQVTRPCLEHLVRGQGLRVGLGDWEE